jgi:polyvinyl alcohol dehydrogenase (cytochrome)
MKAARMLSVVMLVTTLVANVGDATAADAPQGSMLYQSNCAGCHDHPQGRIPARAALTQKSPDAIVQALTAGSMRQQASGLGAAQVSAIATFLTGKAPHDRVTAAPEKNPCARPAAPGALDGREWNGWGRGLDNSRFQPTPGLTASDLPRLRLKWAFGYHDVGVYGQPNVALGRLFIASMTGRVYALDPHSGCVYWTFDADAPARTAISIDEFKSGTPARFVAYLGDDAANLYALDAESGKLLWRTKLDGHPSARITGAPALYRHRLYVPLASLEELSALDPRYECCKFRGSVAAVDGTSGRTLWQVYMTRAAQPYRKSSNGTQLYGPAGVSVWHTPAVDPARNRLYVVTGNSYTEIPTEMSDAVVALDLGSGDVKWIKQVTRSDNYVVGCITPPDSSCPYGNCSAAGQASCPSAMGPDHDFGGAPILRTLADRRDVLLAAQKSGAVYALDLGHRGNVLWKAQAGQGSDLGGSEWGPAADLAHIYVASSDVHARAGHAPGGLTALDFATGRRVWFASPGAPRCSWGQDKCSGAQSQAVTVIPGVVFSGSQDGHLRAYSSADGSILWDVDTARSYDTVNGVAAAGGSLDHAGPVIVNGQLFVNSGYGKITGKSGNVLLAFALDDR